MRVISQADPSIAGALERAGAADSASLQQHNETLVLTVEALKAQLEDQARLAREQMAALLEDRGVREEEAKAQEKRFIEKIQVCVTVCETGVSQLQSALLTLILAWQPQQLTDRLHNTQNLLYDATRDFLELKYEHRLVQHAHNTEKAVTVTAAAVAEFCCCWWCQGVPSEAKLASLTLVCTATPCLSQAKRWHACGGEREAAASHRRAEG